MYWARVKYAGVTIAEAGVGGCYAVDARLPSMSREVESVAPRGARFAAYLDARGVSNSVQFSVSRRFASARAAERFEFMHSAMLGDLGGGGLRYDTQGDTYIAETAQLGEVLHERKGVSVRSTYSLVCGRIVSGWRVLAANGGETYRLKINIWGADSYLTTGKI